MTPEDAETQSWVTKSVWHTSTVFTGQRVDYLYLLQSKLTESSICIAHNRQSFMH